MEAMLKPLREAAHTATAEARRTMLAELRKLQIELEQPNDTIERVMFLNCQMAVVRAGVSLNLFNYLEESKNSPMSVKQLAEKAGADINLVGRILRYLACAGYVREEDHDVYSGNHITACLANADTQSGLMHYFDFLGPIFQSLPEYIEERGFHDVTEATRTIFHHAYHTTQMPWDWFQTQPKKALAFSRWAAARERGLPVWIPTYPLESRVASASGGGDRPLLVDVGGGFGQQARLVRDLYPQLSGKVIVEDFPQVLEASPSRDNVEKVPHDFFTPQPPAAQHARFYYLRQVLHDHSDPQATSILQQLKAAMAPDSRILIDEIVIPNTQADWMSVHMDMVVMVALAGKQRTRAQWEALLQPVGLKVQDVHPYNPETSDAILEVVLA